MVRSSILANPEGKLVKFLSSFHSRKKDILLPRKISSYLREFGHDNDDFIGIGGCTIRLEVVGSFVDDIFSWNKDVHSHTTDRTIIWHQLGFNWTM